MGKLGAQKEHDQVRLLLPWYVNETLAGKDAELVLKHLGDCKDCQVERERLYDLGQLVLEDDPTARHYKSSFLRVMHRIEGSERNKESMADADFHSRQKSYHALGVAASLFLMIMAATVWLGTKAQAPDSVFRTLSSDIPATGIRRRMELGFISPIPAMTMRQALIETNSNLVSGPDQFGDYLVEVIVPTGMSTNHYLDKIRQIEGVARARYAQE